MSIKVPRTITIPLPYLGSRDGYAVYGKKFDTPPDPSTVWELSMRPATREGVDKLLQYVLARKDDFEVLKIKERMTEKLDDASCSKIEIYFIKKTQEEGAKFIKEWTERLHTEIPEEDRKRWLPANSCDTAPQNMTTFHPYPDDHELSVEKGCLFAFSQGGEYSSRSKLKRIAAALQSDDPAYTIEAILDTEYDGEHYYKYRGTLPPIIDLKQYSRYLSDVRSGNNMHGVFTGLLFTYSPGLEEGLKILTNDSPSMSINHLKLGLPHGRHHQIHFVMKPRFWERYEKDYDSIWVQYGDSENLMRKAAFSYTFHHKYKAVPDDRIVYGWIKFHLKIEHPIYLVDVDAVILPSEVLEEAEKDNDSYEFLATVQMSTIYNDRINPFREKLHFVKDRVDAQKVYMERLLYHGLFC